MQVRPSRWPFPKWSATDAAPGSAPSRRCADSRPGAGLLLLLATAAAIAVGSVGCRPQPDRPPPAGQPTETDRAAADDGSRVAPVAIFSELAPALTGRIIARTGTGTPRHTILESLGSGVAMLDYDRDGDPDIFSLGGGTFGPTGLPIGQPPTLLRNDGDGKFSDQTAEAKITAPAFYSHGVCVFDWDRDGFPDLLITGFHGCLLYHNQRDGQFAPVTAAELGIVADSWFTSAASGDFNADGFVDLYLATYVDWSPTNDPPCLISGRRDICPPAQFNPLPDRIYLGTADGPFRLAEGPLRPSLPGKGLGVVVADFDLDGDSDIYVANDTTPNALYKNEANQRLVEVGLSSGTSLGLTGGPDGSMGVDSADTDGDGLPDLWVTNFERESFGLYRNAGDLLFQNVSLPAGIGRLARTYVGFGTAFLDIDADGCEDLFATNGHVMFQPRNAPRKQLPILLHNEAGGRYRDVAATAGAYFSSPHTGRGAAVGDLDGDGDLDLAVTHADEPLAVLRNDGRPAGVVQLRLVGTAKRWPAGRCRATQACRHRIPPRCRGGQRHAQNKSATADSARQRRRQLPVGKRKNHLLPAAGNRTAADRHGSLACGQPGRILCSPSRRIL